MAKLSAPRSIKRHNNVHLYLFDLILLLATTRTQCWCMEMPIELMNMIAALHMPNGGLHAAAQPAHDLFFNANGVAVEDDTPLLLAEEVRDRVSVDFGDAFAEELPTMQEVGNVSDDGAAGEGAAAGAAELGDIVGEMEAVPDGSAQAWMHHHHHHHSQQQQHAHLPHQQQPAANNAKLHEALFAKQPPKQKPRKTTPTAAAATAAAKSAAAASTAGHATTISTAGPVTVGGGSGSDVDVAAGLNVNGGGATPFRPCSFEVNCRLRGVCQALPMGNACVSDDYIDLLSAECV